MSFKGWKQMQWGELATLEYGKSLQNYQGSNGSVQVFGTNGPIGYTTKPLCFSPSVIIGRKGAFRGVHYSSQPFFVIDTAFYLKPKTDEIDTKFAYYQLLTQNINGMDSGSAIPSTSRDDFYQLKIHLPPYLIQKRIASILSGLDDKIELNRQTNQTLEAIAQAIFKEWFVNFKFPGATGEMQDSELGPIPINWGVSSFEQEFTAMRGLSYKGTGLSQEKGLPMHNLNSIYEGGGYKTKGIKYYTGEYKNNHVVNHGDLIIANTEQGHNYRLIGYPAIIPDFFKTNGIISHHIYRLKLKEDSYLTSIFLYHLILQPAIREQVVGFANGTTVNMLKIEGLQKPKFVVPSKSLVQEFSKVVNSLRSMQNANYKEVETLTQLRDTLLPKLMKGEITIPESEALIADAI